MRIKAALVVLALVFWPLAAGAEATVTRQDDAYHFTWFQVGQFDGSYAEWW